MSHVSGTVRCGVEFRNDEGAGFVSISGPFWQEYTDGAHQSVYRIELARRDRSNDRVESESACWATADDLKSIAKLFEAAGQQRLEP